MKEREKEGQDRCKHKMAAEQQQRESTPLSSSGSLSGTGVDPFAGLTAAGSTSGRATTTERRTTTTTTTKRTIKSSDDFMPLATDIQQVRSESRTGSISSTSAPLFNASSQQQQQSSTTNQTSSSTSTDTASKPAPIASSQQKNWSSSTTTTTSTNAAADGIQSPVILDTEEGRILKLRFDVTQYEPDEIVVKTVDNRLTVHAKHEERSENRSVYREYNREFHLPDGIDIEQIKSSLSKDGILTIDCPLPQAQLSGASRRIPIERV